MPGWNFAEIWETAATKVPDAVALRHGDREITWAELDRRANGIARTLLDAGAAEQDKVAQYLYNAPEYMESMYGVYKAGLVPVNTNYRYADDELVYLWDNADAVAVVFHGAFTPTVDAVRGRLDKVRAWLWVDDGTHPCPDWATPYETAAATPTGRFVPEWGRSGDDLNLLYTGGTTGMPKGVVWRHEDVFMALGGGIDPMTKIRATEPEDMIERAGDFQITFFPIAPLMHGATQWGVMAQAFTGNRVVLVANFDPAQCWELIDREGINSMMVTGDGRLSFWCKGAPGAQDVLVGGDPDHFFVPPYVGHKGWIGVRLDVGGVEWGLVEELVRDSYIMTAPKKVAAQLEGARK